MFDIDKERLGAFIAELRKEKGYEQSKIIHNRRQWIFIYLLCLFLCLAEIILLYLGSQFHIDYFIFIGMSVFFGAYFCIFAKPKLP
ncbi:MAG: hypothetical protein IKA09_08275, partial [Lachnospiraceae bacterium]|nr:hypothetical protein [Lachnospiraceae bacterium]